MPHMNPILAPRAVSALAPILALETSTSTCSVAVLCPQAQGDDVTYEAQIEGVSGHAGSVLPLVDIVLANASLHRSDVGLIAFGQGPGAFTGIRLGCSIAQGMAFALNLPIVGVNALLSLANAAPADTQTVQIVALDARMDEVYLAAYGTDGIEWQAPTLLAASDVRAFLEPRLPFWRRTLAGQRAIKRSGQGWEVIDRHIDPAVWGLMGIHAVAGQPLPHARDVAKVAKSRWMQSRTQLPERAMPLYLRDKVAFTTDERTLGLGGNPKVSAPDPDVLLPMTQVDLPDVLELERSVQAFPWTQRNFEDALAAGYGAWVMRREQKLVGFCVAMAAPDDLHLLVIAVDRELHRQGVGKRLMQMVQRTAQDLGVPRILLEVRPSNTRALAFYDRLGFQKIGERKNYYPAGKGAREDAWVLACSFNDTAE